MPPKVQQAQSASPQLSSVGTPLSEVRTLQEIGAFKRIQTCWQAKRDKVQLHELSSGQVRMKYVGTEALPDGMATEIVLSAAVVSYTVPLA